MTARRFLLTGGTGFIGAALVRRLLIAGHQVRIVDNNSRGALRRLAGVHKDVEMIEADIRDSNAITRSAKGIDTIVHLAFINGTEFFYHKPELVLDVGVRGMLSVLDACRANDIGELVLASSSEVYQSPLHVPTDETVPLIVPDVLNPRYSYGGGKIISELLAINYGRTGFERVTIFRPHNVYGPDMGWEHVLPQFALRAEEAIRKYPNSETLPFPILGDGRQTRAFIHIDDFTDGVLTVIEKGQHLNIYHIGNPEEICISELVNKVFKHFGKKAIIKPSTAPKGETSRRCPDISKMRALGFSPRISLDQGLSSLIEWYTSNSQLRPK